MKNQQQEQGRTCFWFYETKYEWFKIDQSDSEQAKQINRNCEGNRNNRINQLDLLLIPL